MKKGFTLIELLVVVLIIGILAAIALPQYQKAVEKARLATLLPIVATIKNAEEVYYMANGTYTDNGANLDINVPCEITEDPGVFTCGNDFMVDLISGNLSKASAQINIYYCPSHARPWSECATTHKEFMYIRWLTHSDNPDKIECSPVTPKGAKLCKMMK